MLGGQRNTVAIPIHSLAVTFLLPGLQPLSDPVSYLGLRKTSEFQAGSLFKSGYSHVDRVLPFKFIGVEH